METNKSKSQLKSEFTTFFEKEAAPLLGEYETNRKKNKFLWICLCLFATSCLIMLFFPLIGLSLLVLSIALMMIHDFFFKEKSNCVLGDVEMNLKTTLMPKFLKIFGEFKWSKYRPEKYKTAASELRALNIFPKISTLGFDDMIEGKYLILKL